MKNSFSNEIMDIVNSERDKLRMVKALFTVPDTRVYIHGAGNFGSATYRLLTDAGITVNGFIDKKGGNGKTHLSVPIHDIDSYESDNPNFDNDIIIIAYICSEETLKAARATYFAKGHKNVIYFLLGYALLISDNIAIEPSKTLSIASGFRIPFNSIYERIIRVASLWEDEESRKVFKDFICAILAGNPDLFSPVTKQPQYFVKDIPFQRGYSRFIDCGAYDGDTALTLLKHDGTASAIACFEPDGHNYLNLCTNLKKQLLALEQILFPCGVWDRSEMLRFRSGTESTCGISDAGDTFIQCVAIDDAIPNFKPTFLKMDVEGAEYEALIGAQNTLRDCKPDLAISVYHRIEHMWEIPILVQSLVSDYRYYLRSHGLYGVETIMYATQR